MRAGKGLIGAALGVAAAGVAGAVAAQRIAVGRLRTRPDPAADEPLGALHGRPREVWTADGVRLHVEVGGDADAPLTVIFVHGWTLTQDIWHYQRRDLADRARLVCYDLRDHGRSGRGATKPVGVDLLGDDLYRVIEAVADGPVVLVGHSMGGMTIMALADAHPELFGERVVGVALVGTSAGDLSQVTLGLPMIAGKVFGASAPRAVAALGRVPGLVDRGRALGGHLAFLGTRYIGFGDPHVSPAIVDFSERMIRSTPMDVVAEYFPALLAHDKFAALGVLDRVPTLILSGTADRLTPPEHSAAMADAIGSADHVSITGTGHLVMLEQPGLVTDALRRLLDRAAR